VPLQFVSRWDLNGTRRKVGICAAGALCPGAASAPGAGEAKTRKVAPVAATQDALRDAHRTHCEGDEGRAPRLRPASKRTRRGGPGRAIGGE